MGYETNNTIMNLGSVFVFILIRILILVLLVLLLPLQNHLGPRFEKFHSFFWRSNVFNGILLLLYESYVELCMSCYLGIAFPSQSVLSGEVGSYYIAWIVLGMGVIFVPLLSLSLLFRSEKYLLKESSLQRYGALYDGIRLENVYQRMFPLVFCLRRLAAAAVIFAFK